MARGLCLALAFMLYVCFTIPLFGTSFMCALVFLDSVVAGAIDGAVGVGGEGLIGF